MLEHPASDENFFCRGNRTAPAEREAFVEANRRGGIALLEKAMRRLLQSHEKNKPRHSSLTALWNQLHFRLRPWPKTRGKHAISLDVTSC